MKKLCVILPFAIFFSLSSNASKVLLQDESVISNAMLSNDGNSKDGSEVIKDSGSFTNAKSDHLFKYADPNINVSADGTTLVLPYEPVNAISFHYLICKDMLATYGDYAVQYTYDNEWYLYGINKLAFYEILCKEVLTKLGYDVGYPTKCSDWRNNEIRGIKKKLHYYFKWVRNLACFSPYDVAGVNLSNPIEVKNFVMDNIRCVDRGIGIQKNTTSIEMKAGRDDWVIATIDRKKYIVTFQIKPNKTGKTRCFTFVMGGVYHIPPSSFIDNGVIVHQAAR